MIRCQGHIVTYHTTASYPLDMYYRTMILVVITYVTRLSTSYSHDCIMLHDDPALFSLITRIVLCPKSNVSIDHGCLPILTNVLRDYNVWAGSRYPPSRALCTIIDSQDQLQSVLRMKFSVKECYTILLSDRLALEPGAVVITGA